MIPPARPLTDGLVVLFEGIDGVGKTTQVDLTRQALETAGWPVLSTRSLGGTPIGEALREVMVSALPRPAMTDLYVSLAIQEALVDVIVSARRQGQIVLMDRGPLSLAAYQIYGGGIDPNLGWKHVQDGMLSLRPELSILYTADVQQSIERGRQQSGKADYFESQPLSYFERVSSGYIIAAERYPVQTVDAGQSIEAVEQQTLDLVARAIDAKLKHD